MTGPAGSAGSRMAAEIQEQPQTWATLLTEGRAEIARAAAVIRERAPRFVLLLARGTSDHAALYGKYLVEIRHALPAGLVSPSTMTAFGARPDLRDVLMIAVSQSGGSADLVQTLQIARQQGALTIAVVNAPDSALAQGADLIVDVRAGRERAVAATKSYTAQLLALYLLLEQAAGRDGAAAAQLPGLARQVLTLDGRMERLAERYRFAQRMVVTARGYSYPTAQEAALKLMETSYLSAQAFSGADLMHGPLAMLDPGVPVLAVVSPGTGARAMAPVLDRLAGTGADILTIGAGPVPLPAGVPEELAPMLEILPLQQLAWHLAVQRGADPDAPRGLAKVTSTR